MSIVDGGDYVAGGFGEAGKQSFSMTDFYSFKCITAANVQSNFFDNTSRSPPLELRVSVVETDTVSHLFVSYCDFSLSTVLQRAAFSD